MKSKGKIIALSLSSFALSVAPILTVLIVNWDKYTTTTGETVRLCIGAMFGIIMLGAKAMDRLKLPEKRIVTYGIVFLMIYFLHSIIQDLLLISGMALLGEVLSLPCDKAKENMSSSLVIDKTAEALSKKVEDSLKNYSGRV